MKWTILIILLYWLPLETGSSTAIPPDKPRTATIIKPTPFKDADTGTVKPRTATIIKPTPFKDSEDSGTGTLKPKTATIIKHRPLTDRETTIIPRTATAQRDTAMKPDTAAMGDREILPTMAKQDTDIDKGNEVPYIAFAVLKNCTLLPEDTEITSRISEALNDGTKMIKFHLNIKHSVKRFQRINESNLYKPFFWVRSTGRHGTGLLLLRPEYDVLSLTTLELGVVTMNVNITESPAYCLDQLSITDMELIVRELVMNDFQSTSLGESVKLAPTDSVCNMHVTEDSGVADFRYMCCQRSVSSHISCSLLQSHTWLNVLFYVIAILKIIVILFSPRFIPDSFYRVRLIADPYIHTLQHSHTMKTVITTNPDEYKNVKNKIKLKKFREMDSFKSTMQDMIYDVPYDLTINQIKLRIKRARLLPEDFAPVGLVRTLYESFFKCKIRERGAVNECCNANFLKLSACCNKRLSWFSVLRRFMTALLLIILATPWIIRVYVYFLYEHTEMDMRKRAASQKSLHFQFPGNVTLLLTPIHAVFIIIYLLLSFVSCIFGVLTQKMKEQFKFVLRKCFRDMREMNQMDVIGWVIKLSVKPCTKYGAIGVCVGLVTWVISLPFLLLILSFYLFPTVNVTLRLFAHFAVYMCPRDVCSDSKLACISRLMNSLAENLEMAEISKREKLEKKPNVLKSTWKRVQQLLVISLCLISMYSIIFLLTEFVSFIVEIFVYTLMGLILNASMTLTYISLIFLLGVYGSDCFGNVGKKFLVFNKTLNGAIVKLVKEKVENKMFRDEDKQDNFAFRVRVKEDDVNKESQSMELITNMDGYPRWQLSRLVLFLSKTDRPMIPKTFYFKSCKMPLYSVPGELLISYIRAAGEFGMILLFLMFVLVVVLAFGDTYEISATNKMLATIAGGFLPFMLRNIVFKKHAVPEVDTDSIHFKVCLHNLLKEHFQTWPIYDIDVVNKTRSRGVLTEQRSFIYEVNENDTTDSNDSPLSAERNPFLNNGSGRNGNINEAIDLLIYIDEKIDKDDFPNMTTEKIPRIYNGSTSLLDQIEPEEKEMQEYLKSV